MYPTLYHLFKDLFNVDWFFLKHIQSFGLIVVIAILVAAWILKKELQRKEQQQILQDSVKHLSPILFISLISGLFGARLFAWLETSQSFEMLFTHFFNELSIYGGILVAMLANYFYLKAHKISFLPLFDAASPSLMLAYGIGRLGCHVSGDGDWGITNTLPNSTFLPDWLWGYNYPNNVLNEGILIDDCIYEDFCYQLAEPVFPTPLYEFSACLILFGILWFYRKKIQTPGILFFTYLIFNGLERFNIELIRVNEHYSIFGTALSQAQIIALLLIASGIIGILITKKKTG